MNKVGKYLKLGIGMMKYSLSPKLNFASIIIFLLLGIMYELIEYVSSMSGAVYKFSGLGPWMLAITPMYALQYLYGVCISGMVQTSSQKKVIMIQSTTACKAVLECFSFAILIVLRFLMYKGTGNEDYLFELLAFGIYSMLMSLYALVVYRYNLIGYAVMLPLIIIAFMITSVLSTVSSALNPIRLVQSLLFLNGFGAYVVVGAIIIALDILLFYVLSKCFYKIPISEKSFKQMLERAKR